MFPCSALLDGRMEWTISYRSTRYPRKKWYWKHCWGWIDAAEKAHMSESAEGVRKTNALLTFDFWTLGWIKKTVQTQSLFLYIWCMNLKWSLLSFWRSLPSWAYGLRTLLFQTKKSLCSSGLTLPMRTKLRKYWLLWNTVCNRLALRKSRFRKCRTEKLKITYFSAIDIAFVNEVLSHGAKDGISFLEGKGLPKPPCSDPPSIWI